MHINQPSLETLLISVFLVKNKCGKPEVCQERGSHITVTQED